MLSLSYLPAPSDGLTQTGGCAGLFAAPLSPPNGKLAEHEWDKHGTCSGLRVPCRAVPCRAVPCRAVPCVGARRMCPCIQSHMYLSGARPGGISRFGMVQAFSYFAQSLYLFQQLPGHMGTPKALSDAIGGQVRLALISQQAGACTHSRRRARAPRRLRT